MSLVTIFRNMFGMANDAIDAARNAGVEARQIVREYNSKIADAERSLIEVKATYEVLKAKREESETEVEKWVTNAKRAMAKGDEKLARECLEAKRGAEHQLGLTQGQIDIIEPQVNRLQGQINSLRSESKKMANEAEMIQARSDIASASSKASETIAGIGHADLEHSFEKIREKVLKDEARAKVMDEQVDLVTSRSLNDRIRELDSADSIDDELEALRKAMK